MIPKVLAVLGLSAAIFAVANAYTQPAAFHLGQQRQRVYWPRHDTRPSGYYYGRYGTRQRWDPIPVRRSTGNFTGGGPGSGK
ncbi:hypothetical protein KR51_00029010 [Rubidibacter lacunae KORDI 51-2]|uniref:Uncharacterized protein n=1 Tax=Rubidibacter lacunae KORDI 51-2 TaxID=582515 RepID=U5DJ10_9CHRO|nr:hypothetical protein [Rubidibacter lacunae]ERN40574.1 hypothetical protein KR51_00029010 [Rubidibacter lacunae KORDI 51-2]